MLREIFQEKYVWRKMSGERCQAKGVTRRMSGEGYQVKEGDVSVTYVGRKEYNVTKKRLPYG